MEDGVLSFKMMNDSPIEVEEPVVDWINAKDAVPFTFMLLNVFVPLILCVAVNKTQLDIEISAVEIRVVRDVSALIVLDISGSYGPQIFLNS